MMKVFALLALVASASAADWRYMSSSTACIDKSTSTHLTCALPTHTSYDKAFTMAASLPACDSGALSHFLVFFVHVHHVQ